MDDMFDMTSELPDFCGDEDGGMLSEFDTGLEPQMRSRAYTWPTRPVAQIVDEQSNASSAASPGVIALAAPHLLSGDDGERGSHGELQLSPGGGVASSRKASSRRNAWGNLSYADLITKAIESSPDKRLTLSQIYAWMVANVPFFSDKGDSNSSAGWKNSIRHNLSLHSRFVRVQNEGTGKSSWWMVNPDAVSKMPRKRAGTMDSTVCRRPTRPKRPSGGLKHTRSTELHAASSGNDLFDPNAAARSPSVVANDLTGFESPRVRANSGNSSTGGCSPATLEPSDIKPSCYTMPPSAWDALYPPKQETLSESLADIFISDATGGGGSESPSTQMYGSVPHGMQPMFMANEAYAHGVPIHQPSPQHFLPPTQSPNLSCKVAASAAGYGVSTTSGFQTNGGQMFGVNGGGSATERVPTLGELLQDQSTGSGYLLNTFLTSGGTVTSAQQQQQQPGWSGGEFCATQPSPGAGAQSLRRPLHINQRVLMQLLATKPHLARRLQQLIEAKRRQLSAMQQQQQQQDPIYPPQMMSPPGPTAGGTTSTTMLQQLLTGGDPGLFSPTSQFPDQTAEDDSGFPKDLDISLQDLQSTSDMSCDIEQVIRHELSFGDKLDFSFDQLHLDEFEPDFAS